MQAQGSHRCIANSRSNMVKRLELAFEGVPELLLVLRVVDLFVSERFVYKRK